MNFQSFPGKIIRFCVLLILPSLFLCNATNYKSELPVYSLTSIDPEMAYLYNGLTIVHGHYGYYVDHPGIPLQYISAAVIPFAHAFRPGSIDTDVMHHPDYYVNAISWVFVFLNVFALFLIGLLTSKLLKSISAGIFIQLTPFVSIIFLGISSRILPEFFSFLVSTFAFLITLFYLKEKEKHETGFNLKYPLLFAIMAGFAVSVKITFLFFLLVPVIVLRSSRERYSYGILTLCSLAIFLIPIWNRWGHFFRWMKGLLIHSGQYGTGNANVVDPSVFVKNLKDIFLNNPVFAGIVLVLLSVVIYFLMKVRRKEKLSVWFYGMISFEVVMLLTVVLIAKQMKDYYLSPAFMLAIPALFFLIMMMKNDSMRKVAFPVVFLALTVLLSLFELKPAFARHKSAIKERLQTMKVLSAYANAPVANASDYYGSPFPGYSVHHSFAFSSNARRKELLPVLVKEMPNFYSYHSWNHLFNYWNKDAFTLLEILKKTDSVYLYTGNDELFHEIAAESFGINRKMETRREMIYRNDLTHETFIKFKNIPDSVKHWEFSYGMEGPFPVDQDALSGMGINPGLTRSNERSLSGQYCSVLDKDHEFGFSTLLTDVEKGDRYTISVWKYKNGNIRSGLVVASVAAGKFYKMAVDPVEEKIGWIQLKISIEINGSLDREDLKVYCWQAGDPLPSFWDDFRIVKN